MNAKRTFWKELLEKATIALLIEVLKEILCHILG